MARKELVISYEEYESSEEMKIEDKELVMAAVKATELSYAPYSGFNVGAAVRLSDGRIVTGANQENSAFPSGQCAEGTALFYAHAHREGERIVSIAVAGGKDGILCDNPCTPCGNCRQVMAEFQHSAGKDLSVILIGGKRIWKFAKVDDILPFIFDSL